MALIPGFEHDIFISYAHNDNTTRSKKWVDEFVSDLKDKLIRSTGSKINIWWDENKIDGNTYFEENIKEGIEGSAILICLHSPSYKNSEWCQKELEYFHDKAKNEKNGLMIGEDSRIVHVKLFNLERNEWPDEFDGRTGFQFYDAVDEELGDPMLPTSDQFEASMRKLRNGILRVISKFKKLQDPTTISSNINYDESQKNKFTIFVGHPPESLNDRPKHFISALIKNGFDVIYDIPITNTEVHQKQVIKALERSHLSIHFLDQHPGRKLDDGTENWYRKKEVDMALEKTPAQLIWMSDDIDLSEVEEEKYRDFLISLNGNKFSSNGKELIQVAKANILNEILNHAIRLKADKTQKASDSESFVLLDNHRYDIKYKEQLEDDLKKNGIAYNLTPDKDEPFENNKELLGRICNSKKLIFIYGQADPNWFNKRLSKAVQIFISNGGSVKDVLVYMAPPEKKDEEKRFDITEKQGIQLQVFDSSNYDNSDNHLPKEFLSDLISQSNGQ
jgi:hypothetical protein